ncbi:MAG: hypothetical protein NT166_05830 [Candidatus Aminicenantes bacterium]|nr:hypothetical protein [Candidatus Aminicenantes bacterium]
MMNDEEKIGRAEERKRGRAENEKKKKGTGSACSLPKGFGPTSRVFAFFAAKLRASCFAIYLTGHAFVTI